MLLRFKELSEIESCVGFSVVVFVVWFQEECLVSVLLCMVFFQKECLVSVILVWFRFRRNHVWFQCYVYDFVSEGVFSFSAMCMIPFQNCLCVWFSFRGTV